MQLVLADGVITATPEEIVFSDESLASTNIQVLFDCCTEVFNLNLAVPGDFDTAEIPYSVNEEDGTFKDGIYQVILTATYEDGSIITETKCIFADTSLKCSIADFVANNPKSEIGPLYVILLKSNECDCNCGAACEIMKSIRTILGQTPASCNCN